MTDQRRQTGVICLCIFTASMLVAGCTTPPILELEPPLLRERCERDLKAVVLYRRGLEDVADFVGSLPELFGEEQRAEKRLLTENQRRVILECWGRLLEYQVALDAIGNFHDDWDHVEQEPQRGQSFLISRSAFLAGYRFALDIIDVIERDPAIPPVLDEPVPEIGLPGGTYSRYKSRYLNFAKATEFAALAMVQGASEESLHPEIHRAIDEDAQRIWKFGMGRGHVLTLANALDIIGGWGFAAWFPVQADVSEWIGDTRVARVGRGLISADQIAALADVLEPGDIILTRREWYLSNVGLPGYWPHAALHVGTRKERERFFDDPDVRAWVRTQGQADGDLEALVRSKYLEAYVLSRTPQEHGHMPRVIEAISEGVSFTTLEHSAAADTLAVLRPRLGKAEKARAVVRAFRFSGRPYDFDFNFQTDSEIVCTELVYKSYPPGNGMKGIAFDVTSVLGRPVMPANLIVRQFSRTFGEDEQQLDLVRFLDGHESEGRAVVETTDAFRESWKRPKWYILLQDDLPDGQ